MNFEGATGRLYMEKNGEMVELGEVNDFKVNVKSEESSGASPVNMPTFVSGSCKVGRMKLTKAFKRFFGIKILDPVDKQNKKDIEALMRREKRRGRK